MRESRWITRIARYLMAPLRIKSPQLYQLSYRPKQAVSQSNSEQRSSRADGSVSDLAKVDPHEDIFEPLRRVTT